MAKQDGWRNRLSDGITIVLSILAAFALDSWWDNYTITRNVENGIRAVAEELVDVVAHLDQRLAAYDQAIEFLSEALELIESTEPNQVVQVPVHGHVDAQPRTEDGQQHVGRQHPVQQ